MSRVDDDHNARRIQEQIALKRADEQRRAEKRSEDSLFSKRMSTAKPQEAMTQQETRGEKRTVAQEAFDRLRAKSGQGTSQEATTARDKHTNIGGRLQQAEQQQQTVFKGRAESAHTQGARNAEVRREGDRETRNTQEERGKSVTQNADRQALAADGKADALRTDGERRGGGGGAGGGKDQGGGSGEREAAAASFRFNPALMAPAPVARPRETTNSDRLRQVANEIAQKIVERVRVGTNSTGAAEFQIDLRGNVLSGLSIKISARNGKIHATFKGSDQEVMKLLKENSQQLRTTLAGRGLTLGDVSFEDRA